MEIGCGLLYCISENDEKERLREWKKEEYFEFRVWKWLEEVLEKRMRFFIERKRKD